MASTPSCGCRSILPESRPGSIRRRRDGQPPSGAGAAVLIEEGQEGGHDRRIEVGTGERSEMVDHPILGPSRAVRPVRSKRVPDVDRREDPGRQRDLLAGEAVGIAGAIPLLVMPAGDLQRLAEEGDRPEPFIGKTGVTRMARGFPLRPCQQSLTRLTSGFHQESLGLRSSLVGPGFHPAEPVPDLVAGDRLEHRFHEWDSMSWRRPT